MFFVLSLLLLTVTPSLCRLHSVENSRYECGMHGKFEYCIDDIPGCVIGCHCHPGYYFDTEIKICEANTKLTDDFRRRYVAEPTRVYAINTPTTTTILTPTTKNELDQIEKDTDELGEWLYNQFFKSIEAQVINKTNVPTRRQGGNPIQTSSGGRGDFRTGRKSNNFNTKRKARKSMKKKGKKKKSKGNGLRRKLLRITEDDSLFDSDSDSDESDNESSSNGDNSSSSSSSSETSRERVKNSTDEREHGHKKVVIFNRRPRPPLPSFIILPNMDTPYYPPLGLPPPPIMPMYPMVPIPPVAPFLPCLEKKGDNNTKTTKSSTIADTERPTESTTMQTDDSKDPATEFLRNKKGRHRNSRIIKPDQSSADTESSFRAKEVEQLKLIQQLRAKVKKKHRKTTAPEHVIDELEEDLTFLNDNSTEQALLAHNINLHKTKNERDAKLKDFKYLSELIHRVNFTDTRPSTNILNDDSKNINVLDKIKNSRRNYNPQTIKIFHEETTTPKQPHEQDPESMYFMNLGRQIASLVRAANSNMNNSDHISKNQNNGNSMLSVLNENRYPSRSYWERSVRSPLIKLKSYFPGLKFYKEKSDDNNLFNLENAVKSFASTVHPMTLQELENILSTLQKQTAEINTVTEFNKSQDLLSAKAIKLETTETTFPEPLNYAQYILQRRNLQQFNNIKQEPRSNTTHYLEPTNFDLPIVSGWILQNQEILPIRNKKQELSNLQPVAMKTASNNSDPNYYSKPTKESLPIDINISQNTPNMTYDENSLLLNGMSDLKHLSLEYPVLTKKYIDKPENHHGRYIKYTESDKHSDLPEKYLDMPTNNHVSGGPELPAKYQDLSDSYKLVKKHPGLPDRHHELPIESRSLLKEYHKSFVLPAKHDVHTNHLENPTSIYREISVKYPDMLSKYIELSGNHPELTKQKHNINNISTNLPDTAAKHLQTQLKHPELPVTFTEQSRRYFDALKVINNNKNLNVGPDIGGKRHYTFVASYPLYIPSYRKSFSKRVESPSYFHHELHHFDYFE